MRYSKLLICAASAVALAGCSDDNGIVDNGTPDPMALVRFINAVPDTGTVDLRFPDRVENLPTFLGVSFRGTSGFFQRVTPGTRPARVFPNSTDPGLTQVRLVDTTVTMNANSRYTMVYAGRAANNQDRLAVLDEMATPPTPPTGNIALKVLHVAQGTGNVDVYVTPAPAGSNNADPIGNAVTVIRNVPFLGMSGYVNVPVRPFATTSTPATTETLYQFTVTAAGSTTPLFTVRPNQPGVAAPAGVTYGAQPGVGINQAVMTVVVAGGSIAGTRQSTSATQTPTVFLIADKTCASNSASTTPVTQC
jgi:hypothetical protein